MKQTRNSAVADKPRDAFVETQWCGWPPKARASPYVLPSRIWSFCGVGINIGVAQKWGALEYCSLGMRGLADTKIHAPPPRVLPRQLGSNATKGVRINRKEPKKLGSAETTPLGWGRGWFPKNKSTPNICYHVKFGSSALKDVCINRKEPPIFGRAGTPPFG